MSFKIKIFVSLVHDMFTYALKYKTALKFSKCIVVLVLSTPFVMRGGCSAEGLIMYTHASEVSF